MEPAKVDETRASTLSIDGIVVLVGWKIFTFMKLQSEDFELISSLNA